MLQLSPVVAEMVRHAPVIFDEIVGLRDMLARNGVTLFRLGTVGHSLAPVAYCECSIPASVVCIAAEDLAAWLDLHCPILWGLGLEVAS